MKILDNYQSLIEKDLKEAEAKHPRATVTTNILKKDDTINKEYYDEVKKKMGDYDKAAREEDKDKITPPATTIEGKDGTEKYHDEIESSEDNLDLTYDMLQIPDSFKKRVRMAIEGSPLMGNSSDWANIIPKSQGFTGPDFGKNLLKIKKDRVKDISQTPVKDAGTNGKAFGVTEKETAIAKFQGNQKGIKTQFSINKKDATSESTATAKKPLTEALTEKSVENIARWIKELGARQAAIKIIDSVLRKKIGMTSSDLSDTAIFASGLDDMEGLLEQGSFQEAYGVARDTANEMLEDEGGAGLFDENKKNDNKKNIKESTMKRLKFKSAFNGKDKAIGLIPESYKTDKKVFEMTDGNETYTIRWEGDAKGNAVVLKEANQMFINEDMAKIKHLMGYNSKDTLGVVTGKQRVDENDVFITTMSKAKALNESENKE